jgi:PAS domain S-box-containing protein
VERNGVAHPRETVRRLRELVQRLKPSCLSSAGSDLEALARELARCEEHLHEQESFQEHATRQMQTLRLRYQELFDFALEAYVVTDLDGLIQEINHAAANLLQRRKEFLVAKPLGLLLATESRGPFYARLEQLRRSGGEVRDWEVRLQPQPGKCLDVALTVGLLRGPDGETLGFRWLLRDITATRRTEESLRAEQDFSARLYELAQCAVLLLDTAGRIFRANPYLAALVGQPADALINQDFCEALIPEGDRPAALRLLRRALLLAPGSGAVLGLRTRDGGLREVAWTARSLSQEGGRPALLLTGQDITELQAAQRKASQAERLAAIGQTMADLAHEGRNALQRCQAGLERLRWKLEDRPDLLEQLAQVQQGQDDLARLFGDLQGYAAPIHLECIACNLAEVWREVWAEVVGRAAGRAAELHEQEGASPWCVADRFRLSQVFRNIFENSLAACADPVRLEVSTLEASLDGRPALEVRVRDNGPGLNAEQKRRIFEPFFTTKARGTGLGMAIAKRILDAHGGRIAVADDDRSGAEVRITLPRSRA